MELCFALPLTVLHQIRQCTSLAIVRCTALHYSTAHSFRASHHPSASLSLSRQTTPPSPTIPPHSPAPISIQCSYQPRPAPPSHLPPYLHSNLATYPPPSPTEHHIPSHLIATHVNQSMHGPVAHPMLPISRQKLDSLMLLPFISIYLCMEWTCSSVDVAIRFIRYSIVRYNTTRYYAIPHNACVKLH